tara:strand:- start:1655 stop:1897 length:243 start_codon:yes stop_codon:yes gene_type:complete
MSNHSAQINEANVVVCILHDSLGRIPDSNIPFEVENPELVLGCKYDPDAEINDIKTMDSFTPPSENKYFDNEGVERDFPT